MLMFQEKHFRCNKIPVMIQTPKNQLWLEHIISINKHGRDNGGKFFFDFEGQRNKYVNIVRKFKKNF